MSLTPRIASVLGLTAALAGLGMTQAKLPQRIDKQPVKKAPQAHPEVAAWKPSKVSGLQLAQRVDRAMAASKRVECETAMVVEMPNRGGKGGMTLVNRIQNGSTYSLRFPAVSLTKREELHTVRLKANGKQTQWMEQKMKKPVVRPVSKVKLAANAKPEDWVLGHPRIILGGVLGESPLTQLVRRASQPGSGMTVQVNERVKRRLNVAYPQYLLIVTRTPSMEKRYGALRIETVIDATQSLPVSVGTQALMMGREPVKVVNNLKWKFRRTAFEPKTFKFSA
ncbi:MAG: hypothetical protein ACO1SV_18915 [Fimbriimonas sp.]